MSLLYWVKSSPNPMTQQTIYQNQLIQTSLVQTNLFLYKPRVAPKPQEAALRSTSHPVPGTDRWAFIFAEDHYGEAHRRRFLGDTSLDGGDHSLTVIRLLNCWPAGQRAMPPDASHALGIPSGQREVDQPTGQGRLAGLPDCRCHTLCQPRRKVEESHEVRVRSIR